MLDFETRLKSIGQQTILCVGDLMLDDFVYGEVGRISPEAPAPVLAVRRSEVAIGGAGNVARNVAALGARATVLSVTGDDEAGTALERLLASEGVATSFLRDPELTTTVKLRVLARRQQLLRIDFERAPSRELLAAKLADYERLLADTDVVVMSDYGKGGLAHIVTMIERARAQGIRVLIDPKGEDWAKYRAASLLTPNLTELRQVIGRWADEHELARKAEWLRSELGVDALLVTRSEQGMTLFTADGARSIPARAREVYDVSGAGDTVIATLGALIAAGAPVEDAMQIANEAAGVVVGKLGTAVAYPSELS